MSRDASLYVADMIEASERVLRFTKDIDRADLAAGSMVHDAVLRNLEVLGEAAKRVPAEVRALAPAIAWRRIAGLRDVLAMRTSASTRTSFGTWSGLRCQPCCLTSSTSAHSLRTRRRSGRLFTPPPAPTSCGNRPAQ